MVRIRPIISSSVLTGHDFSNSAASIKGLKYDAESGCYVGAQGLARLARFVWLMGASDVWRTNSRTFDELCQAIDTHINERIVPMCDPRQPFLPSVTGVGWRADLGKQDVNETQENRFTTWLTKVAAFGALDVVSFYDFGKTMSQMTESRSWINHGKTTTTAWMKAMVEQRKQEESACSSFVLGVKRSCDAEALY